MEKEEGFFENKALRDRFIRLWEKLAERLAGYSENITLELLNEVTDAEFIDKWNMIAKECISRIFCSCTLFFYSFFSYVLGSNNST